jgi:hypothetical protein
MNRIKNDFICTECKNCFSFSLDSELNQNYRIHCPICGHIHYRRIEDGIISDIRFTGVEEGILAEDIRPLRSSCIDSVEDTDKDSYFYHIPQEGFLHRLWKEVKGHLA